MRIDCHSHIIPLETMGKAGPYGPELISTPDGATVMRVGAYKSRGEPGRTLVIDEPFSDPRTRLIDMGRKGIDKMIGMVSPVFYLYGAEPEVAIPFSRVQNDALQARLQTRPPFVNCAMTCCPADTSRKTRGAAPYGPVTGQLLLGG